MNFKPSPKFVRAYGTVAAVFLATIYSNFRVLHSIGVNSFIVLRCSTPLAVSILDWAFLGRRLPDSKSTLALVGILLFGAMYARLKIAAPNFGLSERASTASGLWWSLIWLVSFLLDMVYIKYVVDTYPCSGSERTLYQNVLALPILVILLVAGFEKHSVFEISNAPTSAYFAVVLTCFAGATLSFTGMSLRSALSATSFTVLGILCKMGSTLLNEILIEPEQDPNCLLCVIAVIISGAFYSQAPMR